MFFPLCRLVQTTRPCSKTTPHPRTQTWRSCKPQKSPLQGAGGGVAGIATRVFGDVAAAMAATRAGTADAAAAAEDDDDVGAAEVSCLCALGRRWTGECCTRCPPSPRGCSASALPYSSCLCPPATDCLCVPAVCICRLTLILSSAPPPNKQHPAGRRRQRRRHRRTHLCRGRRRGGQGPHTRACRRRRCRQREFRGARRVQCSWDRGRGWRGGLEGTVRP